MLVATVVQAVARSCSWCAPAGSGRTCSTSSGAAVFRHFQALSPAFHDSYTSGRVISRQTSDVDAIYEMLETGFDGLVTAALTLVGTAGLLLFLDLKLGAGGAAVRSVPVLADQLVPQGVGAQLPPSPARRSRWSSCTSWSRWAASARCRRSAASPATRRSSTTSTTSTARANLHAFRLVAVFMPGIKLIGNVTIAVVLLYGGYLAYHGEVTVGVLAAFLLYLRQFFEPMQEISQFYNTFQSASAALDKLAGVLREEPGVPEPSPDPVARRLAASCASRTSVSPTSRAVRCCPAST